MNVIALKKKYKELFGTSNIHRPIDFEDLNITMALAMKGKPTTPEAILIYKMEMSLEGMAFNEPMRPFCQAIYELYKQSTNKE